MTGSTVHSIRLIGGHPALDFVNTVDAGRDRDGWDVFQSLSDVVQWAVRVGLIETPSVPSDTAKDLSGRIFAQIIAGREDVYAVLLAEADGREPDAAAVAKVTRLVEQAFCARKLCLLGGRFSWAWEEDAAETLLHQIMLSVGELLTDDARSTIRACDGHNCGWLFLDRSRSRRRRFCSEQGCGSHERVRRYRAKQSGALGT